MALAVRHLMLPGKVLGKNMTSPDALLAGVISRRRVALLSR